MDAIQLGSEVARTIRKPTHCAGALVTTVSRWVVKLLLMSVALSPLHADASLAVLDDPWLASWPEMRAYVVSRAWLHFCQLGWICTMSSQPGKDGSVLQIISGQFGSSGQGVLKQCVQTQPSHMILPKLVKE